MGGAGCGLSLPFLTLQFSARSDLDLPPGLGKDVQSLNLAKCIRDTNTIETRGPRGNMHVLMTWPGRGVPLPTSFCNPRGGGHRIKLSFRTLAELLRNALGDQESPPDSRGPGDRKAAWAKNTRSQQ